MNGAQILLASMKYIDLALTGYQMATEVRAEMEATKNFLRQVIAEGRDITAEEWNRLNASIDGKLARLQAAADRPAP